MFQERPILVSIIVKCKPLCIYSGFLKIVILQGGSSNPDFKGFMIQGRTKADNSPVGTFNDTDKTDYQTQCSGEVSSTASIKVHLLNICMLSTQTAATHTNRNEKTSVILTWKAPPLGTGSIHFR